MSAQTQAIGPMLRSGLDHPAGRVDFIPSGVTGKPLAYFTPDPLLDLFRRCLDFSAKDPNAPQDRGIDLLLVRAASYSAAAGSADVAQAQRIAKILLNHVDYSSSESLIGLGREISSRATGLREEIVFSGAVSASTSQHVYAPPGALNELLDSLAGGLEALPDGMDPTVAGAVVGFFCAHMHPFLDGNGRWARLLATKAGAALGSATSAAILAVFLTMLKIELASVVWPRTRSQGFREYLGMARTFEVTLRSNIRFQEASDSAGSLLEVIRRYSRTKREADRFAIQVFSLGRVDMDYARSELGLSMKRFNGFEEAICSAVEAVGWRKEKAAIHIRLDELLHEAIAEARIRTMESV